MTSITERTIDQNKEQGRIEKIFNTPMSRRRFLKFSGAVLSAAMFAEACGAPQGTLGTVKPGDSNPAISPGTTIPVENSPLPHIDTLTGDTFTNAFSNFSDDTKINIPGYSGTIKNVKDLTGFASSTWNDSIDSRNIGRVSTEAVKFALTSAELMGINGIIDFSQLFSGMSLKLPSFNLSTLPNGKDMETATNVFPQNLTIRKDANMIVVGVDDSTNEAIVAFEDTLRKPGKSPTMY